jgi:Rod binding domain-containing protein
MMPLQLLSSSAALPGAAPPEANRGEREACVQFEGVLLSQMMRMMRGTPSESGLLPADSAQSAFFSQYCDAVGQEAAKGSPLGIADMLVKATRS